jgi:gluconate 2-dehydrogenase gamma chain
MSERTENLSRRDLLRSAAIAAMLGSVGTADAQHVHEMAAAERVTTGNYKPKLFNDHEYKTLQRLADYIIPADEVSKGALDAGAPEYIDLLCSQSTELSTIYTGGIAWLDIQMEKRYGHSFLDAKPEEQTAMLDLISHRKNDSQELGAGIHFFDWTRKMVVDAFYTSPIGIKDIGYLGNAALSTFETPQAAIDYALKRSPA